MNNTGNEIFVNKKILLWIFICLSATVIALSLRKLNALQAVTDVRISEICSKNDRVIYDKSGAFNDYVELYNPTPYPINLTGYSLSEHKDFEKSYTIEDEIIESGCYKIIFLKGFGVSDYETVYLKNSNGEVIDKAKLPVLKEDESYAKDFLKNKWVVMEPTPELANMQSIIEEKSDTVEKPQFSKEPGFYEEALYLEIRVPEGTSVYYTLDGSIPTEESELYQTSIYMEDITYIYRDNIHASRDDFSTMGYYIPYYPVLKGNIIRAVAIDENGKMSEEINGEYFVGLNGKSGLQDVMVASIITEPQNLFGFEKGIYVKGKVWAANWDEERAKTDAGYLQSAKANYNREGKGWRREANLRIYSDDRKLQYEHQIEMGIHGGWSVVHNQKGFNLYALPEKDGQQYLGKGLFADKETTLMLRAGGYRDTFSTKIREVLNHQLMEDRDVGILRAVPCQLFLNGEYWGLYCLQERIDASYIESHYGVSKDNIVVLKNKNVVDGEDGDYQLYASVLEFAKNNDLSVSENYEIIKEKIDIQSYIDYFCFQIYVGNCDSITNNYALWRSKNLENTEYGDNRWRWILYDTDDSAGMIDSDGLTAAETNTFIEGYWDIAPMEDELFSSLFQNEEFRDKFAESFIEIATTNFDPERVNLLIDKLVDEYAEGTVLSHQRFVDYNYSMDQYMEEIEILRDFFNRRQAYILKYLEDILEKYN